MKRIYIRLQNMEPWVIWGAAALFALFVFFLQVSVAVMIDPLKKEFNISSFGIGFLASSFFYTYALFQIPAGTLIDKYGVRRVLAVSVMGIFYSCIFFAYSGSFTGTLISRAAMGLFASAAFPCAFCLAAIWFPSNLFPTVVGFTEMLGLFGGAFATNILAIFVQAYNWRSTLLLCACIAATLGFIAIYTVKDYKTKGIITIPESSEETDNSQEDCGTVKEKIGYVVKQRKIWYVSLYSGLMFVPIATFASLWGIPFLIKNYNLSLTSAANCMMIVFLGAAIGNPLISLISHKKGSKCKFMFFGSLIALLSMIIILYIRMHFFLLLPIFFVLGFFCATYVIPFSIVKETVPVNVRGTAMSFTNVFCISIGALLLEPFTGWIISIRKASSSMSFLPGPYETALSVVPICLMLSLILLYFIFKLEKREPKIETAEGD